jgi:hypothetical protein
VGNDSRLPEKSCRSNFIRVHSRRFAVLSGQLVREGHEKAIRVRGWSDKGMIIDGDEPAYVRRDYRRSGLSFSAASARVNLEN